MDTLDFVDWVNEEIKSARIRRTELARIGGIDHGYVSHVLNREQPPGFAFCQAVAKALNLHVADVLYRAGLSKDKSPGIDDPSLYEIVEAARPLSVEKRRYLVTIAEMLQTGALALPEGKKK